MRQMNSIQSLLLLNSHGIQVRLLRLRKAFKKIHRRTLILQNLLETPTSWLPIRLHSRSLTTKMHQTTMFLSCPINSSSNLSQMHQQSYLSCISYPNMRIYTSCHQYILNQITQLHSLGMVLYRYISNQYCCRLIYINQTNFYLPREGFLMDLRYTVVRMILILNISNLYWV